MDRIAVWKTGHQIADTVADALAEGMISSGLKRYDDFSVFSTQPMTIRTGVYENLYDKEPKHYQNMMTAPINDCAPDQPNIGYGILRDMNTVFRYGRHGYFNVDRGYFNPGHFDGTYRISYKGTQAKWHEDIPQQELEFKLEDWRPSGNHILLCPPTEHVCKFFGIDLVKWKFDALQIWLKAGGGTMSIRTKECDIPLDEHLKDCQGVITFNSSIGWQALQRGIPVYSDPDHSIIGSYYKAKLKNPIDFLSDEYRAIDREPLFRCMRSHQFTLKEISEGKAWPLILHYLRE